MDRAEARQFPRARPGIKGPFNGDGQDPGLRPGGQHREPGTEGSYFAVAGPRAFREDQHHFAPFQAAERLLDAVEPQAVTVDGNRVQRVDQPAQRCEVKQGLPGQVVHSPRDAGANQRRVEVALVIGNDQHRPRFGYILAPEISDAIGQDARQVDQPRKN